jgi:hypothetical protein
MKTKLLSSMWRIVLALVFSLSLAGFSAQEARATTYPVTILDDSGAGSLRQAILDANADIYADTITFSVSGTITLLSALPTITSDLTIDGRDQSITISGDNLFRVLRINSSSLTLNKLSIVNGLTTTSSGGGVDFSGTTLTVTDCFFSGNSGKWGGGISHVLGTLTVTDSTFSGNSGTYGGGIYTESGTATVTNSTFNENSATFGGGIFSNNSSLTVANSTFSGNSTDNYGGGIYGVKSWGTNTMTVINSTFSANTAAIDGGGLSNAAGVLSLMNTILANSTSAQDCYSDTALTTDTNNLIENNNGCGTPVSSADPDLESLAYNGGPTPTFALLVGSPAIDAGDDATCVASPVNNLDQRGVTRPYGVHCDIGSFEKNNGTLTTRSVGAQDGWILESGENTNAGGSMDSATTTLRLGDDAARKQYRSILSFTTGAGLPDNAVITKVTLKVRMQGIVGGGDPVAIFQGFMLDIRRGVFGNANLQFTDWQATANKTTGPFMPTIGGGWYTFDLTSAKAYINKLATGGGLTQIRLRFKLDDNNNAITNYLSLYSGNAGAASRPALVLEYYVP